MVDSLSQKLAALHHVAATADGGLKAWRDDIAALYAKVSAWLEEERASDELRIIEQSHSVQEPDLGQYGVIQLAIQLTAGPLLLLVPRGMKVVGAILKDGKRLSGARGRVDLVNFADRRALGLFRGDQGRWFVPTPGEPEPWAELDRDRFRTAMAELL